MANKHSGNMVGNSIDAAMKGSVTKQIETAAESAVPCIGYSWRANKEHGGAELVIVGKHPLAIHAVALALDPINALLLAGLIANGVASSMVEGAKRTAAFGKPEQGD